MSKTAKLIILSLLFIGLICSIVYLVYKKSKSPSPSTTSPSTTSPSTTSPSTTSPSTTSPSTTSPSTTSPSTTSPSTASPSTTSPSTASPPYEKVMKINNFYDLYCDKTDAEDQTKMKELCDNNDMCTCYNEDGCVKYINKQNKNAGVTKISYCKTNYKYDENKSWVYFYDTNENNIDENGKIINSTGIKVFKKNLNKDKEFMFRVNFPFNVIVIPYHLRLQNLSDYCNPNDNDKSWIASYSYSSVSDSSYIPLNSKRIKKLWFNDQDSLLTILIEGKITNGDTNYMFLEPRLPYASFTHRSTYDYNKNRPDENRLEIGPNTFMYFPNNCNYNPYNAQGAISFITGYWNDNIHDIMIVPPNSLNVTLYDNPNYDGSETWTSFWKEKTGDKYIDKRVNFGNNWGVRASSMKVELNKSWSPDEGPDKEFKRWEGLIS